MRIVTNQKLARRNKQIAQYLFFISFALLIAGLFITNAQPAGAGADSTETLLMLLAPALVLPLAFISTLVSVRMTNLWVRPPRPEEAIAEGLKGLSTKSVLYSYYHFPARHVLISPQGIFAIVTRFQDGTFTCVGDRWQTRRSVAGRVLSIFRFDSIGNPSADAFRAAKHVKGLLQPIVGDVEVQPLIVFVDPRVQLNVEDPVVPVVHSSQKHDLSMKSFVMREGKDKKSLLTPEQIEQFEQQTGVST